MNSNLNIKYIGIELDVLERNTLIALSQDNRISFQSSEKKWSNSEQKCSPTLWKAHK